MAQVTILRRLGSALGQLVLEGFGSKPVPPSDGAQLVHAAGEVSPAFPVPVRQLGR